MAEKMITLGKKNTLASRRAALAYITKEDVVTKLFSEIAPTYAERQGGYTQIFKMGPRRGDAAEMAIVKLLVETPVAAEKPADLDALMACKFAGTELTVTEQQQEMVLVIGENIKVRNLGKKSLEEVIQKLHSLGLELKREEE